MIITNLGVLRPDPDTKEFTLTALHPDATVEQAKEATSWDLKVADQTTTTTLRQKKKSAFCATCVPRPRQPVKDRTREAGLIVEVPSEHSRLYRWN